MKMDLSLKDLFRILKNNHLMSAVQVNNVSTLEQVKTTLFLNDILLPVNGGYYG